MYILRSRFQCFDDEFGSFDSVSEAIQRALAVGLPSEEFDVFDSDGVRVAGATASDGKYHSMLAAELGFA
jgi:hypothetical protein